MDSLVKFRAFDLAQMQSWVERLVHNDPKMVLTLHWVGLLDMLGSKVDGSDLPEAKQWESCAQQICVLLLSVVPDRKYFIQTKEFIITN